MSQQARGVFTPLITPFKEDYTIDFEALGEIVDFLVENGVDGFFVNATTGEFTSLTSEEKKSFALFVRQRSAGKVINLLNVSSTVMSEVVEMANFARINGFDGVVSPPPFFLIPDKNGIYNYFKKISEDSGLPTYLYNIPQATGYSIPETVVIDLVQNCPLISGIKITYDSLEYIRYITLNTKVKRPFTVMTGVETYFVPTLISGGDGGIVALSHLAPNLFTGAIRAMRYKDFDGLIECHQKIMRLFDVYKLTNSFAAAIKISLKNLGFKVKPITRLPLVIDMSNEDKIVEVLKQVKEVG